MHPSENAQLDPELARRIAEECYDEVLAYCRRHAPEGHEAADLAQETFLRFVRARSYTERGRPIAYLMRVARSVCVDASRKKRPETFPLDFDVVAPNTNSGDESKLWDALEKLPEDLREVIEMRFSAGLEVNEIARALKMSRFSVRRRISKALELLGQEIEKEDLSYGLQEKGKAENRIVKGLHRA